MLLHETRVKNSGKYGAIGWHTFRHTYRSWLDETGAPMKVQQELMRHASIQTTMNYLGIKQNLAEAVNDRLGLGD